MGEKKGDLAQQKNYLENVAWCVSDKPLHYVCTEGLKVCYAQKQKKHRLKR